MRKARGVEAISAASCLHRVQRRDDLRQQDRALLDRDDLAGKLPVVAEQHAGIGPARRKHRPSPRLRLAGDKLADRRLDAAAGQGADHDVALPGAVGAGLEMLDGAAAAGSKMPARRLDAQRRRLGHRNQHAAIAFDGRDHLFAGQRERHEHRTALGVGDAVALRAEARDGEPRAHRSLIPASRNSRLPSPPSIGEGQKPSVRQAGTASSQALSSCGDADAVVGVAQQAALADRRAAGLELRLDQQDGAGAGRGEREGRRQRQLQRDEADVADEEVGLSCAKMPGAEVARVEALDRRDARVGRAARRRAGRARHRLR